MIISDQRYYEVLRRASLEDLEEDNIETIPPGVMKRPAPITASGMIETEYTLDPWLRLPDVYGIPASLPELEPHLVRMGLCGGLCRIEEDIEMSGKMSSGLLDNSRSYTETGSRDVTRNVQLVQGVLGGAKAQRVKPDATNGLSRGLVEMPDVSLSARFDKWQRQTYWERREQLEIPETRYEYSSGGTTSMQSYYDEQSSMVRFGLAPMWKSWAVGSPLFVRGMF